MKDKNFILLFLVVTVLVGMTNYFFSFQTLQKLNHLSLASLGVSTNLIGTGSSGSTDQSPSPSTNTSGEGTTNTTTTTPVSDPLIADCINQPPIIDYLKVKVGGVSEENKKVQQFLNQYGFSVALSGPGSPGNETEIYGPATEAAVVAYQKSISISLPTGSLIFGIVGPVTAKKMQECICGCEPLSSPPKDQDLSKNTNRDNTAKPESPPTLPKDCKLIEGTQGDADWLWNYITNGFHIPGAGFINENILSSCDISNVVIDIIAKTCQKIRPLTTQGLLECAKEKVHQQLAIGEGNICRHYAGCLAKVIEKMGIAQNYTCLNVNLFGSHCWNQVANIGSPQGIFYIDAFNQITFWCPTGK